MSVPSEKELMQLKELTRMTGTLTNPQIIQLKMWPKVILGANSCEVEFDPENYVVSVDVSNLDYQSMLKDTTETPVQLYQRRMARFNESVKWLLGDEYAVVVRLKGNAIGQFAPTAPPLKVHLPQKEEKK